MTKQAVSQVIDLLVNRGYLEREPDPDDRRRVRLELTDRGEDAVAAVLRGVEAVDRRLEEVVSPEQVGALRSVLSALTDIKQTDIASGAGRARPARQLRRFSPIFPVRDLAAALAHYATLGFRTFPYEDGDDYGFANRDGVGVHLAADPGHDRQQPGWAYLNVRDAAALYEEWSKPGIAGHTHPAEPTPYGCAGLTHRPGWQPDPFRLPDQGVNSPDHVPGPPSARITKHQSSTGLPWHSPAGTGRIHISVVGLRMLASIHRTFPATLVPEHGRSPRRKPAVVR